VFSHVATKLFLYLMLYLFVSYLPPTTEAVYVFARAPRLFVCVQDYSKMPCMDLDEMLRVDRCRDMDELINCGFVSYAPQRGIFLRRENPTYWYWAPVKAATRGFEASKHRCRR